MKIISGFLKNRDIIIPSTSPARPTSSKLRGQVFNICQGAIEGAHLLDLFAGSGAIGIEALSRGARHVTFVEENRQAIAALRKNILNLGLADCTSIISGDVLRSGAALAQHSRTAPFSLVYVDPPYFPRCSDREVSRRFFRSVLELLTEQALFTEQATLFLETRRESLWREHHRPTVVELFGSTGRPLPLSLTSRRSSGDSDLWEFTVTNLVAQQE